MTPLPSRAPAACVRGCRRPRAAPPWLLACLLLPAAAACGEQDLEPVAQPAPPEPGPDDLLLAVDGLAVTFGDVAPYVAWFDSLNPDVSERSKMNRVLDEFVLPLWIARRELAAERQALLEQAQALRSIAGNAAELAENTGDLPQTRGPVTPRDVEIPIAQFLFDPLHVGAVSAPIEVPQGWVLAGSLDLQPQRLVLLDRCEAVQVGFTTHDAKSWADWLEAQKARLRDRVTYFHPDYRDAIPAWLTLP